MTAFTDKRDEGGTVATFTFTTMTFPAEVTTVQTGTLANLNGTIVGIKAVISETEDNITYTIALADANAAALFSEAAMADATKHWRDARSDKNPRDADFNPIPVSTTITMTVTPSAKPDAAPVGTKTATVAVTLYLE